MNKETQKVTYKTSNTHNHKICIQKALDTANDVCAKRGIRLTPGRRKVLELVWQAHKPIGAYDILAQFSDSKKPTAPPTVYRALDFLLEHGFIHRLSSLNAYIGCIAPDHEHYGQFLLCRECGNVIELHEQNIDNAIHDAASLISFSVHGQMLEVIGICRECHTE